MPMKRTFSCTLLALAGLACAVELSAQRLAGVEYHEPARKTPLAAGTKQPPGKALGWIPPLAALPPLDPKEIAAIEPRKGLEPVGVHRSPRQAMQGLGAASWKQAPDGTHVWSVELHSPAAAALRIRFEAFAAGAGEVWVHDGAGQVAGPYSGNGPARTAGAFWSDLIEGDRATVEFVPAAGTAIISAEPPFRIAAVSHLWSGPFAGSPSVEQAGSCQLDVTCEPDLEPTSRAVARLLFEDAGGSYNCTGTLLNNRNEDFTPYLLTAAHCIADQETAESLIAFWNYRTAICNGAPPRPVDSPRTAGATLAATMGDFDDLRGDMSLLVLTAVPDGAFFAGWEAAAPVAIGDAVYGVHHPQGSHMQLSRGEVVDDPFFRTSPDIYAVVQELEGRTEPGSSGSALFNEPGLVTGALSFGLLIPRDETACAVDPYYGGYTHFSALYPLVEQYLEGDAPPPAAPPPPPPPAEVAGIPIAAGDLTSFSLPAVTRPTLFREDSYRLDVPDGALSVTVRAEALTRGADIDLYLRYNEPPARTIGVIVADAAADSLSGIEEITLTAENGLRSGPWYIALAAYTRNLDIEGRLLVTIEEETGASADPEVTAVVSGATFALGPVAPGQIVTLFGQGLGPAAGFQPGLNALGVLPSTAAQTVVLFDEVPAPLFFVQSNQINLQVPYQLAGRGSVRIRVSRGGELSGAITAALDPAAPGLFALPGGAVIAVDAAGGLISADSPARRGDVVVLYGTGEGLTNGGNIAGAPALSAELARPLLPVTVSIGGAPAEVLFAGAAPGFVGLLQLNVRIPAEAEPGAQAPVRLRVGDSDSQAATIAVE